tara:strand:- start:65161 stop:66483 length:1323 start_codon:yes stop_codon:yes gene_type:complete
MLFLLNTAHAALQLELTQGVDAAMPIAVVSFSGVSNAPVDISQVIKQDLQNSGRFRTLDIHLLSKLPHTASEVDKLFWRQQGVNDVVVGSLQALPDGQYKVSYALVNLYASRLSLGTNPQVAARAGIVAQQSFTIKAARLRGLAHFIADRIYYKLTGQRGMFATKIAYVLITQATDRVKQYQLQLADYDGHNPQTVLRSSQPIMSPTWSPNGKQIAYVTFYQGRSAIYINTLATGERQLVSRGFGINGAPAWSPDGRSMAMVLSKDGSPNIYIKNLQTGKLRRITHGWSINTEPAWSPNGQELLFTSDRGGSPQIYQTHLSNNETRRLTYDGSYNARASYTPNAKNIVMLHKDKAKPYGVAIENLQTDTLQVLVQSQYIQSPSVAPNGSMIVYSTRADAGNGKFVLAMVSADGKVQLTLPAPDGSVREPAWSPYFKKVGD